MIYFINFSGKTYQGQRQPNVVQNVDKPGLKAVMHFTILALYTVYLPYTVLSKLYCTVYYTVLCSVLCCVLYSVSSVLYSVQYWTVTEVTEVFQKCYKSFISVLEECYNSGTRVLQRCNRSIEVF